MNPGNACALHSHELHIFSFYSKLQAASFIILIRLTPNQSVNDTVRGPGSS